MEVCSTHAVTGVWILDEEALQWVKLTKLVYARAQVAPGYDRVQLGVRRQAGTSAEMPQELGHTHLLPGCTRLMLLKEDEPGILPIVVPNLLATC